MNAFPVVAALALVAFPGSAMAADPAQRCEVAAAKTIGELQYDLSRRAVEAVGRVAEAGNDSDDRLQQLVTPTASFSLGAGDVGNALGAGIPGLRALAQAMKADTFRFLGWDYIPTPVADPCGAQKVEVEFIETRGRHVFPVTFVFQSGRIVSAQGWSRSFVTGPIPSAR
jgi:hypothetical protein